MPSPEGKAFIDGWNDNIDECIGHFQLDQPVHPQPQGVINGIYCSIYRHRLFTVYSQL